MKIKKLKSMEVKKLHSLPVLLRSNFDVPLKKGRGGRISVADDFKIAASLPTIRYLARYGAKIIIISHLGRPAGRDSNLDLKPVSLTLESLLGKKVNYHSNAIETFDYSLAERMKPGGIALIENLRFYPGEEKDSRSFAASLARFARGGIYVNDAFSVSHRKHASVSAIKRYLPPYAGMLLEREVERLHRLLAPKHPAVAIMGGAKIETKIRLISALAKRYDAVLIGGAMANNIFASKGLEVGKSLISEKDIAMAKKLRFGKIHIPSDAVVLLKKGKQEDVRIKRIDDIGKNESILDIGPETIRIYSGFVKAANTIVWNGPMGKFEDPRFKHGTLAIARLVCARASGSAFGAAGGGETEEAVRMSGMADYLDLLSTGGGAMLAYLGGESMPGLKGIVT